MGINALEGCFAILIAIGMFYAAVGFVQNRMKDKKYGKMKIKKFTRKIFLMFKIPILDTVTRGAYMTHKLFCLHKLFIIYFL